MIEFKTVDPVLGFTLEQERELTETGYLIHSQTINGVTTKYPEPFHVQSIYLNLRTLYGS